MSEKHRLVGFSPPHGKGSKIDRWTIVRLLAALVLFGAAYFKLNELAVARRPNLFTLEPAKFFLSFAVAYELLFAVWLVLGRARRASQVATGVLFGVFAIVSFSKGVSGAESCGCFGNLKVDPWMTFSLDLLFATLALYEARIKQKFTVKLIRASFLLSVLMALSGMIALSAGCFFPKRELVRLHANSAMLSRGSAIQIVPSDWLGYKCPLLDYCDKCEELRKGKWLVLLYNPGCSSCHSSFQTLTLEARKSGANLAVLSIVSDVSTEGFHEAQYSGRLSPFYDWWVETPISFHLYDSVVKDASK